MNQFLKHFRELPRGVKLRDILTVEWVTAVQECLRALSGGENITIEGDLTRSVSDGRVRLGSRPRFTPWGGGGSAKVAPLTFVTRKPAYVPDPPAPPATGHKRYFLTWGLVNGVLASNWTNCIDVPVSGGDTNRYLFMKAMVTTATASNLKVTSCEWLTGTESDSHVTPDWPSDGTRPAYIIVPLGQIMVMGHTAYVMNAGGGSIEINEHIAQVAAGTSGSSVYIKRFSYKRINY